MRVTLNQLLMQGGLIVPYEEELISYLAEGCKKYVVEESFSEQHFTELALRYIEGDYSEDIKDTIKVFCSETYDKDIEMPECVWRVLTFYALYIAILDTDDEVKQAVFSCSLQNCLIKCKGKWDRLKHQDCLVQLYGHFQTYLKKQEVGVGDFPLNFISKLYNMDMSRVTLDVNEVEELKVIGKYAWKHHLELHIQRKEHSTEKDPFLLVTCFLEYLHINRPSIYMEEDIKELMTDVNIRRFSETKKLKDIIQSILDRGIILVADPKSASSILLKMLSEVELIEGNYLDEDFTPQEFMIYLYYELLLESKLCENGE